MDRRTAIWGGFLGVLAATGTGAALYTSRQEWLRLSGEEAESLRSKTGALRVEIEEQGTGEVINRLTYSQDFLASLGAALYATEDYEGYWRAFSSELVNAGSEWHHTPKYWEDFLTNAGKGTPAAKALQELNNRMVQHPPYFGAYGDPAQRRERREQKVIERWRKMVDPRGNGSLLLALEQAQLERDIGAFYLMQRELLGNRLPDVAEQADKAIGAWVETHGQALVDMAGNIMLHNVAEAARMQNPFV